jgi:hypothetical protein
MEYRESEPGTLAEIKRVVATLPAPPKPAPGRGGSPGQGTPDPASARPSGRYISYQGRGFSASLPDNWQVFGDPNAATVTVAPRAAVIEDRQGQAQIGYGILVSMYFPQNQRVNLRRDTDSLIKQVIATNASMRQTANPRSVRVASQQALVTSLESPSPFANQREIDMLVTVARPDGLFYMVFIAPESEWSGAQRTFDDVVRSLRFTN